MQTTVMSCQDAGDSPRCHDYVLGFVCPFLQVTHPELDYSAESNFNEFSTSDCRGSGLPSDLSLVLDLMWVCFRGSCAAVVSLPRRLHVYLGSRSCRSRVPSTTALCLSQSRSCRSRVPSTTASRSATTTTRAASVVSPSPRQRPAPARHTTTYTSSTVPSTHTPTSEVLYSSLYSHL